MPPLSLPKGRVDQDQKHNSLRSCFWSAVGALGLALALALAFDLNAPLTRRAEWRCCVGGECVSTFGVAEVARCRVACNSEAAIPRSDTGAREPEAQRRAPGGARIFAYFFFD